MSTFFGADVDELRQLASTFEHAASQLTTSRNGVGGNVRSSPWTGPVAVRFRSTWDTTSAAQLASAADRLTTAATALRKNAAEQERASSESGTSFGLAPPTLPDNLQVMPSNMFGNSNLGPLGIGDPIQNMRDVLGARYPGMPDEFPASMQDVLGAVPGSIGSGINAIGLVATMTDPSLSVSDKATYVAQDGLDTLAGVMRSKGFETGDPVAYLTGVAASVIGDVVVNASSADFNPSTVENNWDYITKDPGGAALAASQAVVDYLPKLVSDFWPFG